MKYITGIVLILLLNSGMMACKKSSDSTTTLPPADTIPFAKGADVGWITEMEAAGVRFYDSSSTQQEGMALLKSLGMNTIRLRAWVNPSPSWNNTNDVVAKAVRAKNLGMRVMIDFHYSDTWADPGSQTKPAAWSSLDFTSLKTNLGSYTKNVLTQLKQAGVTPEWVQVGNETNDGMLWPDGRASTNMAQFAQLVDAGYAAVKSIFPDSKVIVHLSNGYDNALYRWLFDGLQANNARFDVIGMSLYPSYFASGWQNANTLCLQNMNDMVSRYNKPVMMVEVGMPWDQASTCQAFISDLITKVRSVPDRKGLGVLYWEPLAYANWKGYTLGAFDNTGKPTVALNAFQ